MKNDYTIGAVLERLAAIRTILAEVDYTSYFRDIAHQKIEAILEAENFLLGNESHKNEFMHEVSVLSDICGCIIFDGRAKELLQEITFFQAVKERLELLIGTDCKDRYNMFDAAGVERPHALMLSEKFLKDIKKMKRRNIAFELLKKILHDEIKILKSRDAVAAKKFSYIISGISKRYAARLITIERAIDGLVFVGQKLRDASLDAGNEAEGWSVYEGLSGQSVALLKIAPVVYDIDMIDSHEERVEEEVRNSLRQDFLDYVVGVENSLEEAERCGVAGDIHMIEILEGLFSVNEEIKFHAQNADEDLPPVDYGMKVWKITEKYFNPIIEKELDRIQAGIAEEGTTEYWQSEVENIAGIVGFFKETYPELDVHLLDERVSSMRA